MKHDNWTVRLLVIGLVLLLLAGCGQDEATPTPLDVAATATATNTAVPLPPATNTPVPTPLPTEATTAEESAPTATPAPTEAAPDATPVPMVNVLVRSEETGEPITGATVQLTNPDLDYEASFATDESGQATFAGVEPSTTSVYTVTASASGFRTAAMELVVEPGTNEVTVNLQQGVVATTTILSNLRDGPGLTYDIIQEVPQGETLAVIGVSSTQEWLQVETADGTEGWIFAQLVDVTGDLSTVGGTEVATGPTPTPAPTTVTTPTETITPSATITPTATVTGTVAPPPEDLPSRPGAVPFVADEFRTALDELLVIVDTMRGPLNDVHSGNLDACAAYLVDYEAVASSPAYNEVPSEWQAAVDVYENDVIGKILTTNEDAALLCLSGEGELSTFNYNRAWGGIAEARESLLALMAAADTILSGE